MPTLALAVLVMTAGLLALLLLLLRVAAHPPRPRLVGEIVTVTLLCGSLGWGILALAQPR